MIHPWYRVAGVGPRRSAHDVAELPVVFGGLFVGIVAGHARGGGSEIGKHAHMIARDGMDEMLGLAVLTHGGELGGRFAGEPIAFLDGEIRTEVQPKRDIALRQIECNPPQEEGGQGAGHDVVLRPVLIEAESVFLAFSHDGLGEQRPGDVVLVGEKGKPGSTRCSGCRGRP